jgi:hypothetical protein
MNRSRKILLGVTVFAATAVTVSHWDTAEPTGLSVSAAEPAKESGQSTGTSPEVFFQKQFQPFLKQYCWDCHSGQDPDGGMRLDQGKTSAELRTARRSWEKVVVMLRSQQMPPEGEATPPKEKLDAVTKWLEHVLNAVDCSAPLVPAHVTLRRLTRVEYQNTVRDLLGIDFRIPDDFPADNVGYGFDNIGDVLALPPMLMEKYLAAAEQVSAKVLAEIGPSRGSTATITADRIQGGGSSRRAGAGWWLFSNGDLSAGHEFPRPGEYVIRVHAEGDQAGAEPVKMALAIDGQRRKIFDVKQEGRIEAFEYAGTFRRGRHSVAVQFINDFYDPKNADPAQRDRNLFVQDIEIVGPKPDPVQAATPAAQRILIARPTRAVPTRDAVQKVLRHLATRAYRRPVSDEEMTRLMKVAETAIARKQSFEQTVAFALRAILVSPNFLFRVELDSPNQDSGTVQSLAEYELATRLSYFLWSTMPDDELFRLAREGKLRANLAQQVDRMLKDPKSTSLAENFATQWLGLRNLEMMQPDPQLFPSYNAALRDAMRREAVLFFEAVVREDRGVFDLLSADFTYVNEQLAGHYGIGGVRGPKFRRVSLSNSQRGGVLTQAGVLTVTSNPTRTSPVKRGKWIMENILGTPPPPPPPNVPELPETEAAKQTGSLRQRFELHRKDPVCASCHEKMDPLGFGFENFDAIGAWRTKDGRFEIDPSGKMPGGEPFAGSDQLRERLSRDYRDHFLRCLTEKMLVYALGRGMEGCDRCVIDDICKAVSKNDYRVSTLILEIVKSVPFQKRLSQKGSGEEDRS